MSATRAATFCAARRRRGDHEHLGLREQAGERHLDVAGAGRHVDEQVVEVAPAHVGEELLERLGEDQAAPHERGVLVVDEEAHRHDLDAVPCTDGVERRWARSCRRCPPRRPSTPSMRGTLKPQMSASSTPTVRPRAASAAARLTVTDDLPTPPLPLATASTRVVDGISVSGGLLARVRSGPLHHRGLLLLGHLDVLDLDLARRRGGRGPSTRRRCRSGPAAGSRRW